MQFLLKSTFLSLLLLCSTLVELNAQTTSIEGKVLDNHLKPLEGTEVRVGSYFTLSDENGNYSLKISPGKNQLLIFYSLGYSVDTTRFSIEKGEIKKFNPVLTLIAKNLIEVTVTSRKSRFESQTVLKGRTIDAFVGPGSGVESALKTLAGVSSNNELSSQYNVRGGNFDENLVYVNGIQIYRPFLVRNGQQEGLSFVNSQMVSNIKFSAGGFEARYGDKMSSVLDITYKKPRDFSVGVKGSLLGGGLVFEDLMFKERLSVLVGARYRTNQLLLGTLDTDADFRPQFTDIQAYLTYYLTDEWELSFLGNFGRNKYQVIPSTRTTDFGTFQEALRLQVFFDGREDYDFTTKFGALQASYNPNKNLQLKFSSSGFQTIEQEYFDILGAYRLGELNNNLGSDDFGEISFIRGTGGFQNYARNNLDAIVSNIAHDGLYDKDEITWRWGLKYQYESIIDRYKEWEKIDSAGFSVPNNPTANFAFIPDPNNPSIGTIVTSFDPEKELNLFESFDSEARVQSSRITAYVERSKLFDVDSGDLFVNLGIRTHYWTFNGQNVISPRASVGWKPNWESDMVFRFATGFYYQPPFYREMRELNGGINENIRAQRSIHFVLGNDYQLTMWNRPFKMVTEVYYKNFSSLIPYDLENVRIRYTAENNSRGFATGFDYRINGEFVKGVESWASLSLLTIQEDIEGDGVGFLPRPTDQRFNFKIFFQDYLPNDPTFRVSLTLTYGSGIPFAPPQATAEEKLKDFRLPAYRRVDIGFSKVLRVEGKEYKSSFMKSIKSMWVSLEVFNLLATNNTISYLWIKDASTAREYAVPNFLTGRLLNLKLVTEF
tara:strand:+ start:128609 stop:131101 length:2493 start_codon:yes stop_codon:yes gene_type:complete